MLARTYKTANELGITDIEYRSLIRVLEMLERGEFVMWSEYDPKSKKKIWAMQNFLGVLDGELATKKATKCQTTGCLAGWAFSISNGKAFPEIANVKMADGTFQTWQGSITTQLTTRISPDLCRLFGFDYSLNGRVTPENVRDKLHVYLTTGTCTGYGD